MELVPEVLYPHFRSVVLELLRTFLVQKSDPCLVNCAGELLTCSEMNYKNIAMRPRKVSFILLSLFLVFT